ncbi:MAG: helix-turn-helix transcriptional regulator [Candidatus Izemoplasmatales bacterium]|nr:helix-turn-helix transcriptional regulator [Candidatus Izemoplasmatales bacterium]
MEDIIRENFKKLRRRINITQEQMADFLNLEQSSISKFESGERTISVSNLEKACSLFGIPLNEIYKESDIMRELSPSFRKTNLSMESLDDISKINKIAMNIMEMDAILEKHNG